MKRSHVANIENTVDLHHRVVELICERSALAAPLKILAILNLILIASTEYLKYFITRQFKISVNLKLQYIYPQKPIFVYLACFFFFSFFYILIVYIFDSTLYCGTDEQDGRGFTMPVFGSEGSRFHPWQQLLVQLSQCLAQTVLYKLMKFFFTVYHPVFRMRH